MNIMKKILLIGFLITTVASSAQCWKSVSAGETHSMGIRIDGTLWGWGQNAIVGYVGNGSTQNVLVPIQISSDTDWKEVHAGDTHSIALKNDGVMWAWGDNLYGQLGDGTNTIKNIPIQVGTSTWKMVRASSNHTVGIKTDGTLWAWGNNEQAAVGDGTFVNKLVPTLINSSTDWKMVSCNLFRNVAVKNDGTIWVWGMNSPFLGLGAMYSDQSHITIPTQIGTATDWKMAVVGFGYNLALKNDNTLWAWGGGGNGKLGNGSTSSIFVPTQIGADADWETLEADSQSSFGIKTNNTLWAWGRNNFGQLGNNTLDNILVPTQITTTSDWKSVATGAGFTAALKTDGSLYTWGYNFYGSLGDGTYNDQQAPLLINSCNLGTADLQSRKKLLLYPNPANDKVNIVFEGSGGILLEVYDLMGRLVAAHEPIDSTDWQLDVSNMASGMYIVIGKQNNMIVVQKKLQVL